MAHLYLGVYLDKDLSWDKQAKHAINKGYNVSHLKQAAVKLSLPHVSVYPLRCGQKVS